MFKKKPSSSALSHSEMPDARTFLDVQSERVLNKFDIDRNPVVSTLSEVVEENRTDVDHFIHTTNQDQHYGEDKNIRAVLNVIRKRFLDARYEQTFYDPLDGDPTVSYYLSGDVLNHTEKEQLYTLVEDYYKYLKETNGPKTENKIGRHALVAIKEHGRRALLAGVAPIVVEDNFQKG